MIQYDSLHDHEGEPIDTKMQGRASIKDVLLCAGDN